MFVFRVIDSRLSRLFTILMGIGFYFATSTKVSSGILSSMEKIILLSMDKHINTGREELYLVPIQGQGLYFMITLHEISILLSLSGSDCQERAMSGPFYHIKMYTVSCIAYFMGHLSTFTKGSVGLGQVNMWLFHPNVL